MGATAGSAERDRARRTGAEAIVDALAKSGVDHVFGIAGVHNLSIYDALHLRGSFKTFATRHEQGAAFMADGYARAGGRPAAVLVTTGPGMTNTVTPLAGAWSDSVPLLVIGTAGQLDLLGKYKGYLHEYKDQHGVMDAAARSDLVTSADELESVVIESLMRMQSGRSRPAALEVPVDLLDAPVDAAPAEPRTIPTLPAPDEQAVARAAKLLHEARYPVLFVGGGAARPATSPLLSRLCEKLRAPVLTSVCGKGAVPDSNPWSAGCTWRATSAPIVGYPEVWRKTDAGLVIGSRLTAMSTGRWQFPLPDRLCHLDLDPTEIGKNYPVEERLVGDAEAGVGMLLDELDRLAGTGGSQWRAEEIREIRDADDEAGARSCPEALQLVRSLREGLPEEGILVCDQAMACYWAVRHFRTTGPRRFLYPAGSATLGFGLPAAIGAQIAMPGTPVCVVAGDGGFLFTGTELATAVQYELPLAIVICNDNAYGMIKAAQEVRYGGRVVDTVLRNPDFVAYGRSFGAHAERLSEPAELVDALQGAWDRKGPSLFVIDIELGLPFH